MASRKTGDWVALERALNPAKFIPLLERNVGKANKAAGLLISSAIKERMVEQKGMTGGGTEGPGKLHPFTVHRRNTRRLDAAAKAGNKRARRIQSRSGKKNAIRPYQTRRGSPHKRLIDSGQLLRRITFKGKRLAFIVGVLAITGSGANIASIQEFGKVIKVTPAMRGFLHAKGLHLKPSTTRIEIPGQHYMREGLKGSEKIAGAQWSRAVAATIRGERI